MSSFSNWSIFFLFHKLKFLFIKVSILDTFTANTIMVHARDSTYTTTPIRAFFRSSTKILISALIERRITYETIFPFKNALIGVHHPFLIGDFWDLVEPICPGCFTYNFFLGLGFLLTSSPILRICRQKKFRREILRFSSTKISPFDRDLSTSIPTLLIL